MPIQISHDLPVNQGSLSRFPEVEMVDLSIAREKIQASSISSLRTGNEDQGLCRSIVEWIRADRPAYQQALVYTAVALVTVVLAASIVGLLVVIPAAIRLAEENDKKDIQDQITDADNQVFDTLGGRQKYMALPRLSGRFDIDEGITISPDKMSESLMRAEDVNKRPMILMKLRNNIGDVFVQAIYRRYTRQPEWSYNFAERTLPFSCQTLTESDLKMIRSLALGNSHSGYKRV